MVAEESEWEASCESLEGVAVDAESEASCDGDVACLLPVACKAGEVGVDAVDFVVEPHEGEAVEPVDEVDGWGLGDFVCAGEGGGGVVDEVLVALPEVG